jgi:heme-degrading monooxygenase HmoA
MLVERSEILIKSGNEAAFAAAMRETGLPILRGLAGANNVSFGQGVENPDKFVLLIEWATMDDHIAFTKLPVFETFKAIFAPHSKGGAMEHFNMD